MEHQLHFTVTKELVTTATRRFWLQFIGWGGLIRWAVVSIILVVAGAALRQAWSYIPVAIIVAAIPLIWVAGYFTFLRQAFYRFDLMQNKLITYRFTEQGVETHSDLGSAQVSWLLLDRIQRYPDVWLLFFGRRTYIYCPTAAITAPLEQYIAQQAQTHGKKVT